MVDGLPPGFLVGVLVYCSGVILDLEGGGRYSCQGMTSPWWSRMVWLEYGVL